MTVAAFDQTVKPLQIEHLVKTGRAQAAGTQIVVVQAPHQAQAPQPQYMNIGNNLPSAPADGKSTV